MNKLLILDYDDTLFPTTFIRNIIPTYMISNETYHKNILKTCEKLQINAIFNKLDLEIMKLINKYYNTTKIIIISNAQIEWIIYTTKLFLPLLYHTINKNIVGVISAQDVCKNIGLKDITNWKIKTYHAYLQLHPQYTKIVSIGDSNNDKLTIDELQKIFPKKKFKFIKLETFPTITKILSEIQNINSTQLFNNIDYNIILYICVVSIIVLLLKYIR